MALTEFVPVRDEAQWFAQQMERKLQANDHKEGWRRMTTAWLLKRLRQEVDEIEVALKAGKLDDIVSECADVGNFAMMIADKATDELDEGLE